MGLYRVQGAGHLPASAKPSNYALKYAPVKTCKMHSMKLHIKWLWAVAAVTGSALLFSCSNDDVDITNPSAPVDYVCFRLDQRHSDDGARSDGNQYVLRSADTADTLCMRTEITSGIDTGVAGSRGTQITGVDGLTGFDCYAYVNDDGKDKFYIDGELYSREDNVYRADNTYYWPQRDLNFGFYAVFPSAAQGLERPMPDYMRLQYTVPANVAEQQDLMLAANSVQHKAGDNHAPVPLTFKHLLSGVKIKSGKTMPAGTLKSVTFENVYAHAEYDLDGGAWTDYADAGSFTVTPNLAVDGSEGQELIGGDNTLLMLPQSLAAADGKAAVKMTVVFDDAVRGEKTLTAEISGEWLMGQTHTYVLSITPDYMLFFDETDNPRYADAHYDILRINFTNSNLDKDGGWTLEITGDAASYATLRAGKDNLTPFEKSGYWLENDDNYREYCKESKIEGERAIKVTGDGSTATGVAYLFLEENAGDTDRTITLELYPTKYPNVEHAKWTITQHHPNWDANGVGWESIEEAVDDAKAFPYGFKWDRKVTYQSINKMDVIDRTSVFGQFRTGGWLGIWGKAIFPDYINATPNPGGLFGSSYVTVSFDYSKLVIETHADSDAEGLKNTFELYTFSGANAISAEEWIAKNSDFKKTDESGTTSTVSNYAAAVCLRKNKFRIKKDTEGSYVSYSITPLTEADVKWYLPASGQFSGVSGLIFGAGCTEMAGADFWSSTAVNDNANAKSWNGAAYTSDRMQNKRVRAVRKRD